MVSLRSDYKLQKRNLFFTLVRALMTKQVRLNLNFYKGDSRLRLVCVEQLPAWTCGIPTISMRWYRSKHCVHGSRRSANFYTCRVLVIEPANGNLLMDIEGLALSPKYIFISRGYQKTFERWRSDFRGDFFHLTWLRNQLFSLSRSLNLKLVISYATSNNQTG